LAVLSPRQAEVVRALLVEHPAFEPSNPPIAIDVIADALGVRPSTIKTHLRRIRRRHPGLYAEVMAHRSRAFERYHATVAEARRERSRRWGKRRWAARYRAEHGRWPWDAYGSGVTRAW
jgi:hypothetical protein